ncbi:MAG: T9SS type A sorting domain-containing protein [Candidatus Fibromonas sp.]|nr:T9SS type A sorting domain-containing protein [Candidatus Fibromonas sp.]
MKKAVFLPAFALATLVSVSYAADTPISQFNSATPKKANILGTTFYAYKYPPTGVNSPTCPVCVDDAGLVSDGAAKIDFSGVLNGGVAIGLNTGAEDNDIVDFSGCLDGFKYSYKGLHDFKINGAETALKSFSGSAVDVWTTANVSLADLGTNKDKISKFAWEVQKYDDKASATAISGSLAIKDFVCANGVFGGIVAPPEKGEDYYVLENFDNVQTNGRSSRMTNYYWYIYKVGTTEYGDNYAEAENDNKFAKLTYTLGTTSGDEKTAAGIGVTPSNTATAYYDFSSCTGFSYMYKGASHVLKSLDIGVTQNKGYDHIYKLEIPASVGWKEQTVSLAKTNWAQAPWVPATEKKDFATNKILKFAWEVTDDDGAEGSLSIDDFSCLGITNAPPTIALSISSSSSPSGNSSSSNVNASSSSTVTTSSSSATGGSSSSGSAGSSYAHCIKDGICLDGPFTLSECVDTIKGVPSNSCSSPIILPQLVHSNSLNAMQNAVNLQITSDAAIQIFDLKGNAVRTLKLAQGNYIVPLSDLPHGLYIVKAGNASWKQTVKVAVK